MNKFVPLTSGFMLTSIIGFMVSVLFVLKIDPTWGFTLSLFFLLMFISSVISMSNMEAEDNYGLEHLAIHEKKKKKKSN
jgi:multisubunit Na+/H+ antiporter MnhB subunit